MTHWQNSVAPNGLSKIFESGVQTKGWLILSRSVSSFSQWPAVTSAEVKRHQTNTRDVTIGAYTVKLLDQDSNILERLSLLVIYTQV
jgi:hypothetical protein